MQRSGYPGQFQVLEARRDGEDIRQDQQEQREYGDDGDHDEDRRIDQRADIFVLHVPDVDVFGS